LLVRKVAAGSSYGEISALTAFPQPYAPEAGPLVLRQGAWSCSFDGKDSNGAYLGNGVYLLELSEGGSVEARLQITVGGAGGGVSGFVVAPNPVRSGQEAVNIAWAPASTAAELRVYSFSGGLVRNLGSQTAPWRWDLRTSTGQAVADGIYFITARVPGDVAPQVIKLAVAR
jgi:hypothetical protein